MGVDGGRRRVGSVGDGLFWFTSHEIQTCLSLGEVPALGDRGNEYPQEMLPGLREQDGWLGRLAF